MVSAGSYIISAALLAVLTLSLGFSAVRLRRRLLPGWEGAPARLVESVIGVALLIWLSEILGILGLFYAGTLVGLSLFLAGAIALALGPERERGSPVRLRRPVFRTDHSASKADRKAKNPAAGQGTPAPSLHALISVGVVAIVFAHWGLTTADALNRGIFNFDSLWYHMPFAVEMAQSHSVTGLHYTETVFTNWFYPQNSELLHTVGILLTERDTLSLFLNFGWLGMAFLAAWCIGRPYGRGHLSVIAVAILLASHTLVVREPGAAKNDVMAAALLLAAIAILVHSETFLTRVARGRGPSPSTGPAAQMLPLAAAGLATGMAAGTKSTALAIAAALTVAVLALAPAGRRLAAAGWWFLPALAGGGYWYLRNLIVVGNPLPQLEAIGPISLPHPEQLQSGRPDFSVAHYATDTAVWTEYFTPELHQAFGFLWPVVLVAAIAGALAALIWSRERVLRWMGAVAMFGLIAYIFTPLTGAGAEGAPEAFGINLRYAVPALLAGLALLPLALRKDVPSAGGAVAGVPHSGGRRKGAPEHMGEGRRDRTRGLAVLSLLVGVLLVTDRLDAVVRDPDRIFAWLIALLFVLVPAALLFARSRGLSRGAVAGGFAVLGLVVVALGYPLQRDYLRDRFANADPQTAIPGMRLDSAYRWARGVEDARIGLAGTSVGFLQHGFYGTDLSNQVRYLGVEGPRGAFNAIPECEEFRTAVNAAELDYLVTAPFLNFIEPGKPIQSPEAGWLRGELALTPLERSGAVTVWRVRDRLDPTACGPRNAPLRYVPQQPG